jgi:DNA-binding NarL/FixJ family response regulator
MSINIPSVLPGAPTAAESPSSNTAPAPQVQPVQPTAQASADTVRLTAAEQVYQLYNQGQKVSQIASSLSLSVAAVNSYLNLSKTSG